MDSKLKERERESELKALRKELEAKLEEALAQTDLAFPERVSTASGPADVSSKRVIEALLFSTAKPLTVSEIRKVLQGDSAKEIERLVLELKEEYRRQGRSFELVEIAGGWEIATRKEFAPWLARLEQQKKLRQASHSALETLAILAYKQPVTRAEIEELRGVDISAVLSTLLERGFIKITGKKEVPGRPFLYGTTEKFLEHFGLKSLTELPPVGEIKTLVERAVKKEPFEGEEKENEPGTTAQ